jgi:NAD(P)-dependent dehydrogenase (short-subunit alcohol dehydrogenase family)
MQALNGKVAIITGASSGIGRATAKLFAQHGARLILVARRGAELDTLVQELALNGASAVAMVGDVRDEACAKSAVAMATERYGGLDIAFNNAGTLGPMADTAEISADAWRDALDTNLTSAFLGAKYQIPAMKARGRGAIVFTSSFVGYTAAFPMMAAYAASKAGIVGLTQALAVELGPAAIRVNAILPGGTDTPMGRAVANSAEARRHTEGLHALKRLAEPEEIAHAVLYLASDASSFTTGSALLVDGGVSINRT